MLTLRKIGVIVIFMLGACNSPNPTQDRTAEQILGNPEYTAISFGGFREKTRKLCPSVEELKEDMKLLNAMGIKLIRTYNTQLYPHAERTLQAIRELKQESSSFEMYVMLGAWIECKGAWTEERNHEEENVEGNQAEIQKAIELANEYTDIVKIIAVGNESMVHWAESYFVTPSIVLKYVVELQELKSKEELSKDLWITSSDNFASWGGGSADYHKESLLQLIQVVDYVSMHTYPFHDTHYNPEFWQMDSSEHIGKDSIELMKAAMQKARDYAIAQFEATKQFVHQFDPSKPIHIGETGWASSAAKFYGENGSNAAGEFQQKLYYDAMRAWTAENHLSCFFFEAFDEPWKDTTSENGSENHFGLINRKGEAKYVLWDQVDAAVFEGLTRGGLPITKTFSGNEASLLSEVMSPPYQATNQ